MSSGGEPRLGEFDETTGAIVAHLRRIPDNVRCLEITVSDWRYGTQRYDVTPGNEAFLKIAPLMPGYVYFYGAAYSVACADIYGPNDGGPYGFQTWYAEYTSAEILPGRSTPVSMTFRRLGGAEVSVDFSDEPPCGDGGGCPPVGDAGFAR
ncbi:MAG: hypothetical protein ABW133_22540 [Polyangiaceae bacterium]